MKVKRTIWIPVAGGLTFGYISYLIFAANINVQISDDLILGPWEIMNTLSAAVFGPIGLLITQLGMDIGGHLFLIRVVYPALQDIYFMVGGFIAHFAAMLVAAFSYRFIYKRMIMSPLLAGWILILFIYYLIEIHLAATLFNIAVPDLGASYLVYFHNVRLEYVLVTIITLLILLALAERYRKPQWYEAQNVPDQEIEITGETVEGSR